MSDRKRTRIPTRRGRVGAGGVVRSPSSSHRDDTSSGILSLKKGLGRILLLVFLAGCGAWGESAAPPDPTPTAAPSPLPSPIPTPARWPIRLHPALPEEVRSEITQRLARDPRWGVGDSGVEIGPVSPDDPGRLGMWIYALAAPFPTVTDGVSFAALRARWQGQASLPGPLFVAPETMRLFAAWWGPPDPQVVIPVPEAELVDRLWATRPAWALVPFHRLEPRLKVIAVDGLSPMERGLDPRRYPLAVGFGVESASPGFPTGELQRAVGKLTNRDEDRMTILAMTGVTALVRGTAVQMERYGVLFPARDIAPWLQGADLTHISNEVSFWEGCPPPRPRSGVVFCSDPRYVELLTYIGTDIVELTGNHLADYGKEPLRKTLALYRRLGMRYYGGGENLEEALRPLQIEHNGNRLAFVGCNPVGPAYDWATPTEPGAAPCVPELHEAVRRLRAEGWLPIVTLQYWEFYDYAPTPQQVQDFRFWRDLGAVIVSGSQGHHAQTFEVGPGWFIHYGLGNLFFDQVDPIGVRQTFIDWHVFYEGRYLGVLLRTAFLEDLARPRPMTPEERRALLEWLFALMPE
ncbi:poly-gamma-glutamate synthesis protein (capsule biosynthesis protein) [Thermoflexus hugenholtzii JAD2]|uniref:Poly-gamma-glutamate synthesis protein (Capsule biosynthesis protein) n=1 Tax=Thermoflexus hugenholtzii JAD2 TaxID=877466 RepID=A0A212RT28_9CHLR|nr:poly-gamma-glutamate synthesis protein (capsule biosynthesis protein) [Thermoflexus hugenholtzii JAD2]